MKRGLRKRSLTPPDNDGTGRCIAWTVEADAPLTVEMLVCHTGDRRTKTGELYKPEFARGEAVAEFNKGRPLVHHFKLAGEKYELDLEKLATKETAILERYTNPGIS